MSYDRTSNQTNKQRLLYFVYLDLVFSFLFFVFCVVKIYKLLLKYYKWTLDVFQH